MENTKQLNVPLPEDLLKELKAEAERRGMKLYGLVEEIIANALKSRDKRGGR